MDENLEYRREDDRIKYLIIEDHINPIRERLIGVEKAIEYEQKITTERFNSVDDRMGRAETKLDSIVASVEKIGSKVNQLWWMAIGTGTTIAVLWAILKLIMPYVSGS